MRLRAAVLSLALLGAGLVYAAPPASPLGPTGLFTIPTADTLAPGAVNVNLYGYERSLGESYAANYGAFKGLEIGFAHIRQVEQVVNPAVKTTIVNAKYEFLAPAAMKPGIAVGALDITNSVNTDVYLVATEDIPVTELYGIDGLRAHLGLAAGGNKNTAVPLSGFFGAVELDAFNMATVSVEHDGTALNAGLRLAPLPGLSVNLGTIRKQHITTYGLSYTYPM